MRMRRETMFITGYVVALLVLAVLGYSVGDYTYQKQQEKSAAASHTNNFATDVGFISLPRMNMSITSLNGQAGRLRIDVTLEVEQKNMGRLEDFQPIITDRLVNFVRKLDMDDVRKPNAIPTLRNQLLKEVNSASYPVPVMGIVFRQFVVM